MQKAAAVSFRTLNNTRPVGRHASTVVSSIAPQPVTESSPQAEEQDSPVCAYNEWDLLEVHSAVSSFIYCKTSN